LISRNHIQISWDALRGKLPRDHDNLSVRAESAARSLAALISNSRDGLLKIPQTITGLQTSDLELRIFMADDSGIVTRDGPYQRTPTQLRYLLRRLIAHVNEMPERLQAVEGAAEALRAAIAKHERISGKVEPGPKIEMISPDELDRRAAANPFTPSQTKADGAEFSGYESDRQ
jgi:hypothetical protein